MDPRIFYFALGFLLGKKHKEIDKNDPEVIKQRKVFFKIAIIAIAGYALILVILGIYILTWSLGR